MKSIGLPAGLGFDANVSTPFLSGIRGCAMLIEAIVGLHSGIFISSEGEIVSQVAVNTSLKV